mgnify:FL=1
MCYLRFDKTEMTNLQDSLYKEMLLTNDLGAYCCTTLVGCNIRKYHGLLVTPVPNLDDENHVLLASLDETVIQHGAEFNLGIHKYQGENFSPKGHKYIIGFEWDKIPTTYYRIGGVILKKEIAFHNKAQRLFIRYTLEEAHSPTTLRLRPYLAFRSVRQWTHENGVADKSYEEIANGIKMNLYAGYPDLYMQVNKKNTFVYEPNWYKGLDYPKERERGYDSSEDLLVPGYFEMPIKKGETIIFSASIEAGVPAQLPQQMEDEISKAPKYDSFYHCLVNAAHQFDIEKEGMHYILAGYPWFKCRARDTFISLPGLTLSIGEEERFDQYMATAEKAINQYIHKQPIDVQIYEMEQPDTLLWAIWCLQQYAKDTSRQKCYERYGQLIGDIIAFIRDGQHANLVVHENHLLYSNGRNTPITWMNSTANGRPIIPRSGYIVEFNALWYNALRFYALLLTETGSEENRQKAQEYEREAEDVSQSFKKIFLNEYGYLLGYVDGPMMDWSVRPNQIFAIALDFSPLDLKERKKVLDICTKELVTPKGIRSLSPKSGGYTPMYVGPQSQRDQAYHQGTAWPWLTGFYLEAYLRIYKMSGLGYIERQLIGFEEELFYHCIGTIPELFDGNPPFSGRGAISFAMNVSGILRAIRLYERNKIED